MTHGVPNEPTVRTSTLIDKVTPVPLGVIHSTHDEFFSVAEVQMLFERLQILAEDLGGERGRPSLQRQPGGIRPSPRRSCSVGPAEPAAMT